LSLTITDVPQFSIRAGERIDDLMAAKRRHNSIAISKALQPSDAWTVTMYNQLIGPFDE